MGLSSMGRAIARAAFACACASLPSHPGGAPRDAYVLAVVPSVPPLELHRSWAPFVERLSRDANVSIELRLFEHVGTFLEASDAGEPDLLFAAPNMFFLSHRAQGYLPLVRSSLPLTGVIFVRRDSPFRTVRDLRGRTIAFVGPMNSCAVLTRSAMEAAGGPLAFRPTFTGSALNVVTSVLVGKADAGASLDSAFRSAARDVQGELRVIFSTPPAAAHPLAAHPRVPAALRERIAAAVLAMAETEEGSRLLAAVRLAVPTRAEFRRDYLRYGDIDLARLHRAEP